MICNNCGSQITTNDNFCPYCGVRLVRTSQPVTGRTAVYSTPSRASGKRNGSAWVVVAIIVALALIGGALYMGISHEDEQSLWEKCERQRDIASLSEYIKEYPNGEHITQARQLYEFLLNEKAQWEQLQTSDNEYLLRTFIAEHPQSKYRDAAHERLDDVVWDKAVSANSKAAYRAYVNEFPTGKHAAQARAYFDELTLAELTAGERDNVTAAVRQFLDGLEGWNENDMLAACNPSMDNFMGKSHATHADVMEYYRAFTESDIDSIAFTGLNVNVTKTMNGTTPSYSATFTVARHLTREFPERGTEATMRGEATLDNYFRFTTLTIDKE